MGMSLYLNDNNNLCLIDDEDRSIYTLATFDKDSSRRIIWHKDKHKELTEFVDRIFKSNGKK